MSGFILGGTIIYFNQITNWVNFRLKQKIYIEVFFTSSEQDYPVISTIASSLYQ